MSATPRSRTGRFHLPAPVADVMPLFTAEGERRWAPAWSPEILSGGEARGSAFRTRNSEGQVTTWIVAAFAPDEGRATYARIAEGSNIGLVDVSCATAPDGGAVVTVTYTLTPLGPEAEGFVADFLSPGRYGEMMNEWARLTTAALAGRR